MQNLFADYGKRATSTATAPLVGPIGRRADARLRYTEIVAEIQARQSLPALREYLASIHKELIQFRAELDFYWEGEGDFLGLSREIERAQVRLDDGLDHPRYEEGN